MAEVCGVFAEPEILSWKINPEDKFAIIASDGVFEFITSQACVDLVSKFAKPLDAAKHIVAESYRLWLTFDDRTDDITIIIINFDDMKLKDSGAARSSNVNRTHAIDAAAESKPVRKVMSKNKRKVISENWNSVDDTVFDFEANATPKVTGILLLNYITLLRMNFLNMFCVTQTPAQVQRIADMVKTNFMFQNLTDFQRDQIFKVCGSFWSMPYNMELGILLNYLSIAISVWQVMILKPVKAGENIIKEGAAGDEMYIIDRLALSGTFRLHYLALSF